MGHMCYTQKKIKHSEHEKKMKKWNNGIVPGQKSKKKTKEQERKLGYIDEILKWRHFSLQ